MGFPRHEYWSGLPFHPPGDLPDPGIKPASPVSLALAGRFFATEPPGKPKHITWIPLNTFNHLLASCPLWKQPETLILLDLSHFINLQKQIEFNLSDWNFYCKELRCKWREENKKAKNYFIHCIFRAHENFIIIKNWEITWHNIYHISSYPTEISLEWFINQLSTDNINWAFNYLLAL